MGGKGPSFYLQQLDDLIFRLDFNSIDETDRSYCPPTSKHTEACRVWQ